MFDVLGDTAADLIAVGRLDLATSGLLLLTSDTRLADWITDPGARGAAGVRRHGARTGRFVQAAAVDGRHRAQESVGARIALNGRAEGRPEPSGAADVRRDRPRGDEAQARQIWAASSSAADARDNFVSCCVQKSPRPSRARRSAKYDLRQGDIGHVGHFFAGRSPRRPSAPRARPRFPIDSSGISPTSFPTGMRGSARTTSSTARSASSPRCRARWRRAPDRLLRRLPAARRNRAARVQGLVLTRRSAYDQDQRDNQINARRQQVQILFAKAAQASAWFDPELLTIPLDDRAAVDGGRARSWRSTGSRSKTCIASRSTCSTTRASTCCRCRAGFRRRRNDAYAALSTADVKHPTVALSSGAEVTLTYGQYRAHSGDQPQPGRSRRGVPRVSQALRGDSVNTYASLYNGVLQRDWFHAQARGYGTTLDAALHGNNIPTAVVENLIETTKAGTEPLRRYHRLRKTVLGLETYHAYDTAIPLVEFDRKYPYDDVLEWLPASVAPLGADYQRQLREVAERQVDRRLRESGQAQRRVLGARLRRPPVHAAELQRHARRGVHAGARDGALDAHAAVARAPAVRVRRATRSSSPKCRRR